MTKTSEGPAGMSIEIMASLFCEEKLKKEKESDKDEKYMHIYWGNSLLFIIMKFIRIVAMRTSSKSIKSMHTCRIIFAAVTY